MKRGKTGCYIPKRYVVAALSFFGLFCVLAMRVNLSVAMIAMVNHTIDNSASITSEFVECENLVTRTSNRSREIFVGEQYNWDPKAQGLILGAFFYGYIVTQLPGGFLAQKFGTKWLIGGGTLITAVLSLLTPLSASLGTGALIAVRILEGIGAGVTFPATNLMISQWAPKMERSRLSTIIFTGATIGGVVSMPVSGWLSGTDLLGGWPSAFYVFGSLGCLWFVLWAVFVYETPSDHPSISKKELDIFMINKDVEPLQKAKTPWKSIFTSLPMWAVIVSHFGHNFGYLILQTELPTYLSTILRFNIKDNGLLSAVPYMAEAGTALLASFIADRLRRSNKLSITSIRKICNSIGLFGPAACLLCVTVSGCRPELIVVLISLGMALNGFTYSGFGITHVDMSPDFAGTLFGISNCIACTSGFIGPAVVGLLTEHEVTMAIWNSVFYITAALYITAGIFYAVFASAEVQPWGEGNTSRKKTPVVLVSCIVPS